ncbi:haptoglobin [Genypterus blacodes]|uniref:haptoglobin n=1 Tax=Genypterus blacodes TaxID=154954 RepID=UPI003F77698B
MQRMDFFNMWFSLAVFLLAAVAHMAHAEGTGVIWKNPALPASRLATLRSKRMTGGTLAPHVPWQAMVYLADSILDGGLAGGALISDRWVLTAGRNLFVRKSRDAIQGTQPVIPKVYLGIRGRQEANASTEVAVEKVVLHPHFQNTSDWDHNLALIQLKEPVVMGDKVAPIPLPERGPDLTGNDGVLAGWGWGALFTYAPDLKYLRLPLVNQNTCQEEYKGISYRPTVDDDMFCTEAGRFGDNVCTGDSGGALALRDPKSGDVYAAGILSYDNACRTNKFGVYMKISSYLPWIHSVIRGDTERSSTLRSAAMSKMLSWQ